jgi:1,4-alpha-glucan branching enzyme
MTGGARKPKRKKAQRKGTLHAARSRRDPAEVITDGDLWLYAEGRHFKAYRFLGAHQTDEGVHFAVWAPNASDVSVIGDFNGWVGGRNELFPVGQSGIWHAHVPGARAGQRYKYRIRSGATGEWDKSDPAGTLMERDGGTASVVFESSHVWRDQKWMATRLRRNAADSPMSIYECHLGSWRRVDGRLPTYRELARELVEYVVAHGFTHVELLPLMEHPFYGSWGYQSTGYFAPTSRYGSTARPDARSSTLLHQRGIGVILDWVPSHFPNDAQRTGALRRHASVRARRSASGFPPRLGQT